uniref:Primosome PriB/single-strand DNA-binding n=1 Tax=uncultured organism TaxID=155900 RepID=M1PPT8_9ZZZZ|nr:primosome PriB/single-strand DNA-binding [uncultured organism]
MQGINQVVISGNLTDTPDLEYTKNGKAYTSVTLAVNSFGEDEATFIPVQVWGDQAENVAQYLDKGSGAEVVGRLDVSSYQEDGEYKDFTRVVARRVNFLGSTDNNVNQGDSGGDDLPNLDDEEIPL